MRFNQSLQAVKGLSRLKPILVRAKSEYNKRGWGDKINKCCIDDKKGSKGYVKYIADIGHTPTEVKFHFEVNNGGDARASITSSDPHLITTQTTGVSPSDHPLRRM